MRAFLVDAARQGSWRPTRMPDPAPGTALVRVRAVGLCGTDAHLWTGLSPNLQRGLTTYPWQPGHEWCGEVVAVAGGAVGGHPVVGDLVVGDPFVTCGTCEVCRRRGRAAHCPNRVEIGVRGHAPGALAEFVRVPVANLTRVPDGVRPIEATLAEPATTALHALDVARLRPGGDACVIGTGTLGLIAIQVAVAAGADVSAVGVDDAGLALAESIGATVARPGELAGGAFDTVIEASGARTSLAEASRLVSVGGSIGLVGYPAEAQVPIDAAGLIMAGASLHGVLGGIDRMRDALVLISRGVIDPAALIDGVHGPERAAQCLDDLMSSRARPKLVIAWEPGELSAQGTETRA